MYTYTYMPRVTIHIRNEDWDKWNAIPSVPAWLHEHLNEPQLPPGVTMYHLPAHEVTEGKSINGDEPHYEDMEETA